MSTYPTDRPIEQADDNGAQTSIFDRFLDQIEQNTSLKISFEDLSGISLDLPDLRLSYHHYVHSRSFCEVAQSTPSGQLACRRNKVAANRVACSAKSLAVIGQCRLGVTDIVKALSLDGRTLGVFYMGAVALEGYESSAGDRIRRDCARTGLDPATYLEHWRRLPLVTADQMEVYRRQLDFIVEFAIYIIRANDAPVAQYKTEAGRHLVDFRHRVPLVMEVIRLVGKEFSGPVEVSKLAALVNCNPDYMNRIFRQQTGMTVHEYLARVRIDHALKLMRVKTFSLAEVASTCGFADQSHFSRTFKKYMGFPPSQYAVDECLATAICGESFAKLPTSVRRYEANKKSDRF